MAEALGGDDAAAAAVAEAAEQLPYGRYPRDSRDDLERRTSVLLAAAVAQGQAGRVPQAAALDRLERDVGGDQLLQFRTPWTDGYVKAGPRGALALARACAGDFGGADRAAAADPNYPPHGRTAIAFERATWHLRAGEYEAARAALAALAAGSDDRRVPYEFELTVAERLAATGRGAGGRRWAAAEPDPLRKAYVLVGLAEGLLRPAAAPGNLLAANR